MKMTNLVNTAILVAVVTSIARAGTNNDIKFQPEWQTKLLGELLYDYHPDVAPTHNGPVNVNMGFSVGYFNFINEQEQLAIVHGWSYRTWYDPRLQWNQTDYNGTRRVILNRNDVWVPDIEIHNSAKVTETIDSQLIVYSTGKIRYYLDFQIEFICDMDITFFPFDEQECQLKFGSWHYTSEVINLIASNSTNIADAKTAKDFQMTNLTVKRTVKSYGFIAPYSFIDVTYTISLKRQSSAYSIKLVLPSVLTGFLILATFLLPTASHEKITLCGILFMCLLVLMTFLHLIVPSSGNTILGQYLVFALFIDFFATIMAVVSYNVKLGVITAEKQPDVMLHNMAEEREGAAKPVIPASRKMTYLRYLDVACFALFSLIFIVGLAIILGHRE